MLVTGHGTVLLEYQGVGESKCPYFVELAQQWATGSFHPPRSICTVLQGEREGCGVSHSMRFYGWGQFSDAVEPQFPQRKDGAVELKARAIGR